MIKKILLFSHLFFILLIAVNAQTVIWTEDFQNNCAAACVASTYNGTNGAWTITNVGVNDPDANEWFVSGAECGNAAGTCGSACGTTDPSLHVGNVAIPLLGMPADNGAAYNAGGGCPTFFCVITDKRAESPTINLTGQTNITLNFNYIENGDGTNDDASLWYFDGATWSLLDPLAKPSLGACNPQGQWTAFSIPLPASANNNANVKIGFRWVNNDDAVGTDPSFAVDDITLTIPTTGGNPTANFTPSSITICEGDTITFTDGSTTSGTVTYSWIFPTGTPGTANTIGPHNVIFPTAGTHHVSLVVTDANGTDSTSVAITVNPAPTVVANATNTTICSGDPVTLTGSGASSYTWDNGVTDGVAFNPTTTTTYTVTGTDANGCSATDQVTVTVNNCSQPTASFSASSLTVCVGDSITFTDNSTGTNISGWNWTFPGGTPGSATTQGPHTVVFNTPGTHNIYLQITDANGTDDTTITVTVNNCSQPTASFTPSAFSICVGDSIVFTDNSSGTINTWNWTFQGGNPLIANTPGPHTVYFNNTGTFNITLQINYTGGSDDTTITITVDSCLAPIPNVMMDPGNGICKNGCVNFSYSGTGGTPTSWNWNFEAGSPSSSTAENPGLVCWNDTTGRFIVSLEVTNTHGTNTYYDTITVSEAPVLIAYSDTTITLGTSATLTAQATDSLGNPLTGGVYFWSPPTYLSCVLCQTTNVVEPPVTAYYYVSYEADNGCTVYDTVLVTIDEDLHIGLPTAFTPNGDGSNDVLYVRGQMAIESLSFTIYNRYGQEVFHTTDKMEGWDGTHNGKAVNSGVFVYVVQATLINGLIEELKGNVTLIK